MVCGVFEEIRFLIEYLMLKERKKECERSQLRSMDWCGERPFGHRAAHHLLVTNSFS